MKKNYYEINKNIYNELIHLYNLKQYETLEEKIETLIFDYPKSYNLLNLQGVLKKIIGKNLDSVISYKKAIKIKPNIAETYHNLGLVYVDLKKIDLAITNFKKAININQNNPFIYNNLAAAQLELNKLEEAKVNLDNAIRLKTDFFQAFNNMGMLYKKLKDYNQSIIFLNTCIKLNVNFSDAYHNLGETYYEMGNIDYAILNYNLSLNKNPNSIKTLNSLAYLFSENNKINESIKLYQKSLDLHPYDYEIFNNLGNLFLIKKNFTKALFLFKKAYDLNDQYSPALLSYIYCKMSLSDWSALTDFEKVKNDIGINGKPIPPFYTLNMIDDPKNLKIRTQNWSKSNFIYSSENILSLENNKDRKIRIGYFSSDFHDHAVLFLISGHLKAHNTNKFEIYIFSFGYPPQSNLFDSLKNRNNIYIDISNKSDEEAVGLIRKKKLDFAIDLNGFTTKSRTNIFAKIIAPIQINYLGYPGSMSSKFMNYIVADNILIDETTREYYQEKIIFMPNCYQPNDDERFIGDIKTSRTDHDLTDSSFVICCFNNTYKISKYEFDIWLNILKKVDKAVLWLLDTSEEVKINLINYALMKEINPQKIIFAKKINHSKHLERLKHADIFVDTFNYNAHTTCSDALWAGVPVITKKGKQFSARVASSLLTAIGLEELISNTESEYAEIILDLALNSKKLLQLKDKLKKNISIKPLFNTKQYTKDFEASLEKIFINRLNKLDDQDIFKVNG
jgi:protein O-GlcNAc transferase